MINKTEKSKLKKHLKSGYVADVLAVLAKQNITNAKGLPFSPSYIRNVFNGRDEHHDVELAIYQVFSKRKIEQSNLRKLKQEIVENKNPEAATSGLK